MSECTGVALPTALELVAYGTPAPQGSKRHVGGGRMIESSLELQPWRESVKLAARALIEPYGDDWRPWDGPIRVRAVFTLRKPLSAPKTRRTYPISKPDVSKLIRSTEDALTDAGVWRDDSRVIGYERLEKVYPGEDPESLTSPGVRLRIWRVE
jgi:Holliday junction resolvase RusA-like endonuclease